MAKRMEIEIKVGLFVSIGVGLIMLAILILGSSENILERKSYYNAYFDSVDGLVTGARVVLGGIPVGTVKEIDFDDKRQNIRVDFSVARKYSDLIRKNSQAEIATQGVLGDKYISINAGSPDQTKIDPGTEIPNKPSKDISEFFSKSDQLLISLNRAAQSLDRMLKTFEAANRSEHFFTGMATTAKNLSVLTEKLNHGIDERNLRATIKNLNGIFEKINNGTGTLGALINDPGLYDDAKALFGGANRNRIIRNLVRQTIKKSEEAEAEAAAEEKEPKRGGAAAATSGKK